MTESPAKPEEKAPQSKRQASQGLPVNWVLGTLALIAALIALHSSWQRTRVAVARDFFQVWLPVQVQMPDEPINLYDEEIRRGLGRQILAAVENPNASPALRKAAHHMAEVNPDFLDSTFTPVMVGSYLVFQDVSYDAARLAFGAASLALFAIGVLLTARLAGLSWATSIGVLALLAWTFHPLRDDITDGNVNRLQLGVVAIYLWLTLRYPHMAFQILAGLLVGWLVLFKPNLALLPILIVIGLFAAGGWRRWVGQCIGGGAAAVLGLVGPWLAFGDPTMWLTWLERMSRVHETPYRIEDGNIAAARLILENTGLNVSLPIAVVLVIVMISLVAASARRQKQLTPRLALFAAGGSAMVAIIASQLAWPHYVVLLVPLLLAALSLTPKPRPGDAVVLGCYFILAGVLIKGTAIMASHMTYGWALAAAILILASLAAYRLVTEPQPVLPDTPAGEDPAQPSAAAPTAA